MKYKEFVAWCNERCFDGCWDMKTAMFCINLIGNIDRLPFWKREKEWRKVKDFIETGVVLVIEEKMRELKGGE